MRIAIDASCTLPPKTGVGYYAHHMIRELVARAPQHQFKLLLNSLRHQANADEELLAQPNARGFRYRIPGPWLMRSWQRLSFPPLEMLIGGFDLFHGVAAYAPPRLRGKCVLTVHDLYFKIRPEHCDALGGLYLAQTMERSLRRADAVIAVSNATKRDLLRFYDYPADRVHVVYEGVDELMEPPPGRRRLELIRSEYCLPEDYILAVSTLEPRKNLPSLFRAYARLKETHAMAPKLVVVGLRGWKTSGIYATMRELDIAGDVVFTDYVAREHMPAIYAGARLFVFPTLHEGFGLPALEAMACGAPVAGSNVAALREIGGDAIAFFDPEEPDDIARTIKKLLLSSDRRDELRTRGFANARRFDWKRAARRTMRVYESVLNERPVEAEA